jgi:hypothetical protein
MHVYQLALALVFPAAVIGACSGDAPAGVEQFELRLVVDGSGTIETARPLVDCVGPKDCGVQTAAGLSALLRATAAPGYGFAGWQRDGVAVASAAPVADLQYRVDAAKGSKVAIRATFVPAIGGGGGGDAGILGDASGSARFKCGKAPCASTQSCCTTPAINGSGGEIACRPSACDSVAVSVACTATSDCGAAEVCCLQASPAIDTQGKLACVSARACPSGVGTGALCDMSHPCPSTASPQPGTTTPCVPFNPSVSYCGQAIAVPTVIGETGMPLPQ